MTDAISRPTDGSATGVKTPPPDVLDAAREKRMGQFVAMRKGSNPVLMAIAYFVAAGVLVGVMTLAGLAGENVGLRSIQKLLGFIAVFACVFMVGFLVAGVAALVRGARSHYVWTEGFMYRRNGRIRSYRWVEIAELRGNVVKSGDHAGKISDYTLTPQGADPITVPLELSDGRDEFIDALIAGMRRHDRPVV